MGTKQESKVTKFIIGSRKLKRETFLGQSKFEFHFLVILMKKTSMEF
jgi:hypothetical protein